MLNFCWICLSLIILYIFINHFHYGDLKEVSCNHSMERFNCSPSRPSNCRKADLYRECLYVFNQQKRRASIVFFAGCESGKKQFGIIKQLFKQLSASKEFPKTALNVFKEEQFDFTFGLWRIERKKGLSCFTTFNSCKCGLHHVVPCI